MVKELFNASNTENITGTRLAPRLTVGVNETTTVILVDSRIRRPAVLVNGSAELSNSVLRNTLVTKLYSMNTGIRVLKMIPAPTITCLMNGCGTSTNVVVSTSRGPFRFGNVGVFDSSKYGLPSSLRGEVRRVMLSRIIPCTSTASRGVNEMACSARTTSLCVSRLISTISYSFRNVRVTLSYSGNSSSEATRGLFAGLNTGIRVLFSRPSNIGVGHSYNSARVDGLRGCIHRRGLSYNLTFSNSTSEYLTISRGKGLISNSCLVTVYTGSVGRENMLGGGTIIKAVVAGVNFGGFYRRGSVRFISAGINSECILRTVVRRNCGVNNRRDNRVVLLSCTAANSNRLSNTVVLDVVGEANRGLDRLTGVVRHLPRILVGMGIDERNGLSFCASERVGTRVREIDRVLNSENEVLIHISKARPLMEMVLRNRGLRRVRGLTRRTTRMMERELTWYSCLVGKGVVGL